MYVYEVMNTMWVLVHEGLRFETLAGLRQFSVTGIKLQPLCL